MATYQQDNELAHFPLVVNEEDNVCVPRVDDEVVVFAKWLDMLVGVLALCQGRYVHSCNKQSEINIKSQFLYSSASRLKNPGER